VSNSTVGTSDVTGNLQISQYPLASSGLLNQKLVLRVNKGYNSTTSVPLALNGYMPLWYNSLLGLYIFRQKIVAQNTSLSLQLLNLINPEKKQKDIYGSFPYI